MKKSGAFTIRENGIKKSILSEVHIMDTANPIKDEMRWRALWDTGATCTFISRDVVERMGLTPTTYVPVDTFRERDKEAPRYNILLRFPNGFSTVVHAVGWGHFSGDVDVVIGMDVISRGDFSITNPKKKTTFSFRLPSITEIDFEKESDVRES